MNQLSHARKESLPPGIVMARSRFGKYEPEERVSTRRADVSGDELQRLRDLRKMIRDMKPEDVMNMITFYPKLTVFEALALANREGALIVPNVIHDRILNETRNLDFFRNYSVWTGTMIIYESPGKVFEETLVHVWNHNDVQYSISFNIPDKFRGNEGCALVVEHPDFDLVHIGNNHYELKVADENMIHLVDHFPSVSGEWWQCEELFGIPTGSSIFDSDKRQLFRTSNSHISLLVRDGADCDLGRDVDAYDGPSDRLGVAVIK